MKYISEQKIIYLFGILIAFCFVFLAYCEHQQRQSPYWSVYFENSKNSSLDFIIENHSEYNLFSWEARNGGVLLLSGEKVVYRNETGKIKLKLPPKTTGKIEIIVTSREGKRELYKILKQ